MKILSNCASTSLPHETSDDHLLAPPLKVLVAENNQLSSSSPSKETPETTIPTFFKVTNSAFMKAIFIGLRPDERPMVAEIYGDDILKRPDFSGAKGWIPEADLTSECVNHYFTLSTYLPIDGTYKRRKSQVHRSYGIYFDDIGTKAKPRERLNACPPSYMIETSPGNFHAGYLFESPVDDLAQVEELANAAADANFTDPGAKGFSSRLGRLPRSINGKFSPYFQCRLVEWHPEIRYSISEIYQGLELKRAEPTTGGVSVHVGDSKSSHATSYYSPRAGQNPVISALRLHGLYKDALGESKHDITCPWVHEHTDRIDSGTAYFEPTDQFPYGGFKCQHGHCAERKLNDFLKEVGVTFIEAKHKATIYVIAGELDGVVDAAEIELSNTGNFYQRAGSICHVVTDPGSKDTAIKAVNNSDLTRVLSKHVNWVQYSAQNLNPSIIDPPMKHVNFLFSSGRYKHLPVLHGLARQPYLRPDGSLMVLAGYDLHTGLFGVFDESKFSVPQYPSREAAVAAYDELSLLMSEFSFENPYDKAAAIAMMITAVIRTSLPLAPMAHIKAPQISSGKSYLCDLIAAFSGPAKPAAYAFPTNDEECSKLLLAAMFESPAVITFDNLTSDLLPFKSLCSALTAEHMTGRILGVSQTRTVGTRTLFLSSGNNVGPVRDMSRRVVTIMLDPQVESPATRRFRKNPLEIVLANRAQYVSLALTIVRAYIVAGSPIQKNLPPLASYGEWTKLVRSPLAWLGQPDPAKSLFITLASDPDREILGRLLLNLNKTFNDKPTSVSELVTRVDGEIGSGRNSELAEVVREISEERGKINRRRLGRWISRHQGVLVDGLVLSKSTKSGGSERWQVIQKQSLPPAISTDANDSESNDYLWPAESLTVAMPSSEFRATGTLPLQ